jgi:hypothetical protein
LSVLSFFFFFYIASHLCLSYNKFWEINHHLEAFIWSPNNLFGLLTW